MGHWNVWNSHPKNCSPGYRACRVCGNPHGLIKKYGLMSCRQRFRSNAKEIVFIKYRQGSIFGRDALPSPKCSPLPPAITPTLYAVLEVEPPCDDTRVLRSHFKRLALLLNPAENKFAFAQEAFDRVTYAWSVLSYPAKKAQYDAEAEQKQTPDPESPQRSSGKEETELSDGGLGGGTFWTVCPYCYYVYEYDRFYEGCCLKCQACMRAFHGVAIAAPPPTIPGKDEYCCCSAYFPMGFITPEGSGGGMGIQAGWPFSPMFSSRQAEEKEKDSLNVNSENVETGEGKKWTENMGMHEHERRGERGKMPYFARPSARNNQTAASNTKKIMGKGVKKHETGRLNLNAGVETESETEDGEPGIVQQSTACACRWLI
ncbi:uncharacterized protein LOC131149734 [Malania oleifera]|uniref:uncharacterized protein LOC131149734 n=1 Tax=Malania oleifera TaxID=397392 RepID=UPI0025ADAAFA|nr:uncharacterized protein LOC131149734 [Malania oleifera]